MNWKVSVACSTVSVWQCIKNPNLRFIFRCVLFVFILFIEVNIECSVIGRLNQIPVDPKPNKNGVNVCRSVSSTIYSHTLFSLLHIGFSELKVLELSWYADFIKILLFFPCISFQFYWVCTWIAARIS